MTTVPSASEKLIKTKLRDHPFEASSDEAVFYQLRRNADELILNGQVVKTYFDEVDLSMDPKTKIWLNRIIPGFYPNYHCHDYYEFNVIFEGECPEIIGQRAVTLEKGDILILPANSAFHTHYLKSGGRGCNLIVRPSYLAAIRTELSEIKDNFLDRLLKKDGFCVIHTASRPAITKDTEDLLAFYYSKENQTQAIRNPPSALSRMYVENTFCRMMLMICQGLEDGGIVCEFSDTVQRTVSSEEIIMYIKNNYASVSTAELSKKYGYSRRQLSRIVRRHSGSNFSALVTYERVIHAKNLLKNTSLSVAEIAKAVGLDSKEYFCTMFRRQTKMTPTEYKKAARNAV